jgi:hypothetical protein
MMMMMILIYSEVVIVIGLVDNDIHSKGDDYPLKPILSPKQIDAQQEVPRCSAKLVVEIPVADDMVLVVVLVREVYGV